ncbi:MAG: hypothetical protein PHG29_12560 [Prolixibacteraceae bacterium]|jgi:hypothetical protein|nr:hypothetical protein [Prolixibacteraceae bacterium]NLO02040.1 hypothetical protein [Bacteroidales bacterium]
MNYLKFVGLIVPFCLFSVLSNGSTGEKNKVSVNKEVASENFKIGWSMTDITPDKPVLLSGQFHARVSEAVHDPVYATSMALENGSGPSSEKVIMISCDLVGISDDMRDGSKNNLRDRVRGLITSSLPELKAENIIIHATHSHTAPYVSSAPDSKSIYGVELDAMSPAECLDFISKRIAKGAEEAWKNRQPGGISYGLGHAVVARNRLQSQLSGETIKTGSTNRPGFSHIEGFEDHTINLIYTWDNKKNLTGVVINIAADCQVTGGEFFVSADFWYETREELKTRLGDGVFVLPQCASAGDQGTVIMVGARAEQRMQEMMYPMPDNIEERLRLRMGYRKKIANQIADAVTDVYPYMADHIDWNPPLVHKMERAELSRRLISQKDVDDAVREAEGYRKQYEEMLKELNENPSLKEKERWYRDITRIHSYLRRGESVKERYDLEKVQPKLPVELHVVRLGDIVIATNPFELYLDYGMRIKARSSAIQTFIVQLAGGGTYLPTERSIAGGAYGAVPASTLLGPEGGQELVEKTLELIYQVMPPEKR